MCEEGKGVVGMKGLLTTTVGSFPKPDYLKEARKKFRRGLITETHLKELEKKATKEVIKVQEELGIDILVDGEMYRGDMATFFAEKLEGFKISGLVRSYGNRYYRKPIVVRKIKRTKPVTIDTVGRADQQTLAATYAVEQLPVLTISYIAPMIINENKTNLLGPMHAFDQLLFNVSSLTRTAEYIYE